MNLKCLFGHKFTIETEKRIDLSLAIEICEKCHLMKTVQGNVGIKENSQRIYLNWYHR